MGRGAGEPNSESAQRPEPELSVPRRRLIQRFTLIESNYEDLKESLRRHYPDEQSFVDDWTSAEFESHTLGPEAGVDVFDAAKEFSRLLPKAILPIRSWVDTSDCDPRAPE